MIKEFCHKLKEKRCSLGHSIEGIVEKTKLYPSVIRDIEAADFARIDPAYLKGFMKIYASFLGVDTGEVFQELDSLKATLKKPKPKPKAASSKAEGGFKFSLAKIPPELRKKILTAVLAIVLLWILIAAAGALFKRVGRMLKSHPAKKVSEINKIPAPLSESGELAVSLTVKKKCFVRVVVDGVVYFEGVLAKGIRESWKGKKEINLKISDGSAVSLEVNGKAIPTLTSLRKPIKSLKITSSGISVDK